MLVLSRKLGEDVIIAGNISISIVGLNGNRVKLGIDAPRDISIRREELAPHWTGAETEDLSVEMLVARPK